MSDNLNKDSLMSLYPSVLDKDALFNALGQSVAESLGEAFLNVKNASIYTRIAELDEAVLDILAKDFKISWYDYDFQLETKRRVIAAAFSVHRHLGTTGAMITAICAIWPHSTVEEWFEYNGNPFYFRVLVNANDPGAEPIRFDAIDKTVKLYKNERSWLEDDRVILRIYCGIIIRTAVGGQKYHSTICGTLPRVNTHGDVGDSGIVVGASAGANSYHPIPCGTPLGALM